jgi:L-fuculose-phosphate aldolase
MRRQASENELRRQIVEIGRRLYAHNLISANDGNASVRLGDDRLLITPTGLHKGTLSPEQVLITDLDGQLVRSYHPAARDLRPSVEILMHLEAYRQRPDVRAVIHAHPPMAIACTLAGVSLAEPVLPEVVYHLKAIPTVAYATPGGPASAAAIRELIRGYDALLLERHGSLTVGRDLELAYLRTERIEHVAAVMLAAHARGPIAPLPADEVARLLAMHQS